MEKRARKTLSFITQDFQVTDAMRAWATKNTMPDPDQERDEFVDHWISVGKPMADWDATFRNRLRFLKRVRPPIMSLDRSGGVQRRPRPDATAILKKQEHG